MRQHRTFKKTLSIYVTVGGNIARAREKRGLSQTALADEIGVHRVSLVNMEAGRVRFPLHKVERIAEALGMSVWELLKPR